MADRAEHPSLSAMQERISNNDAVKTLRTPPVRSDAREGEPNSALVALLVIGAIALVAGAITWITAAQQAAQQHEVNALFSTLQGSPDVTGDTVPADAWVIVGIVACVIGGICLLAGLIIAAARPRTRLEAPTPARATSASGRGYTVDPYGRLTELPKDGSTQD